MRKRITESGEPWGIPHLTYSGGKGLVHPDLYRAVREPLLDPSTEKWRSASGQEVLDEDGGSDAVVSLRNVQQGSYEEIVGGVGLN